MTFTVRIKDLVDFRDFECEASWISYGFKSFRTRF